MIFMMRHVYFNSNLVNIYILLYFYKHNFKTIFRQKKLFFSKSHDIYSGQEECFRVAVFYFLFEKEKKNTMLHRMLSTYFIPIKIVILI